MKSSIWRTGFELAKKRIKLKELEKETEAADFWLDREKAQKIEKEIANTKEEIEVIEMLKTELKEIEDFLELTKEDESLVIELERKTLALGERIKKESWKIYLSGKHDKGDALLEIFSGAGGRDAQDWATMLQRMYERCCAKKGFKINILEQSFGETGGPEGGIGIKHLVMEISGKFAFGLLKGEAGVHRLVRISPFSPQKLRHTSFAQILVYPKLKNSDELEIKINPADLKIETFRASGPGGQYMQKTESAVRITHLPTKTTVSCQSERAQAQNKKKALEILCAKLYRLKEQERQKTLKEIKGKVQPAWGNQIRSYVLHPYKLVKDLRTGIETSKVEEVLNGNLDEFIDAEIKIH